MTKFSNSLSSFPLKCHMQTKLDFLRFNKRSLLQTGCVLCKVHLRENAKTKCQLVSNSMKMNFPVNRLRHLGENLSIYIPWPFSPVWGVANNTKE